MSILIYFLKLHKFSSTIHLLELEPQSLIVFIAINYNMVHQVHHFDFYIISLEYDQCWLALILRRFEVVKFEEEGHVGCDSLKTIINDHIQSKRVKKPPEILDCIYFIRNRLH